MRTLTRLPVALLLAALSTTARSASAQEGGAPQPGARVRVWSHLLPSGRAAGLFQGVDSTALLLVADGSIVRVALGTIDSVQVSRGWEARTGRGALIGALAGGAALALIAAASTNEGEVIDPQGAAVLGFVAGGVGGALLGGIIGHMRGHERWETLSHGFHHSPESGP
jgi:hypothetical protein